MRIIVSASKLEKGLWFIRCLKDRFAVSEGNDLIVATVNNEDRTVRFLDVLPRRMLESRQQAHRQPGIDLLSNIWN